MMTTKARGVPVLPPIGAGAGAAGPARPAAQRTGTRFQTGRVVYQQKRVLDPLDVPRGGSASRCQTPARGRNVDTVISHLNAALLPDWLTRSNAAVKDLQAWWHEDGNGIALAHFWLSVFSNEKRKELLEMEYSLLGEELQLGFQEGLQGGAVTPSDVASLLRGILWEYPHRFGSDDGSGFLDLARALVTEDKQRYRDLLSAAKVSTTSTLYGQWILVLRSFALITMVTAVTTFFRRQRTLVDSEEAAASVSAEGATVPVGSSGRASGPPGAAAARGRPTSSAGGRPRTAGGMGGGGGGMVRPSTAVGSRTHDGGVDEAFAAAKAGHADVVYYYLNSGVVPSDAIDGLGRTLLFVAVAHRRNTVVAFLLDNAGMFDINRPADSGSTALHVAVNNEDLPLVELLVAAGADPDFPNPSSKVTPRQLAQMLELHQALEIFSRRQGSQHGAAAAAAAAGSD